MQPGAPSGRHRPGIGHDLALHGSEAAQVRSRGALSAPRAASVRYVRYACPTTSVSLFSSAWWLSSPQLRAHQEPSIDAMANAQRFVELRGGRAQRARSRDGAGRRAEQHGAEPAVEPFPRSRKTEQHAIPGSEAGRAQPAGHQARCLVDLGERAPIAIAPAVVDQRDAAVGWRRPASASARWKLRGRSGRRIIGVGETMQPRWRTGKDPSICAVSFGSRELQVVEPLVGAAARQQLARGCPARRSGRPPSPRCGRRRVTVDSRCAMTSVVRPCIRL